MVITKKKIHILYICLIRFSISLRCCFFFIVICKENKINFPLFILYSYNSSCTVAAPHCPSNQEKNQALHNVLRLVHSQVDSSYSICSTLSRHQATVTFTGHIHIRVCFEGKYVAHSTAVTASSCRHQLSVCDLQI